MKWRRFVDYDNLAAPRVLLQVAWRQAVLTFRRSIIHLETAFSGDGIERSSATDV
jgi:hypothetical protein